MSYNVDLFPFYVLMIIGLLGIIGSVLYIIYLIIRYLYLPKKKRSEEETT
jgi:hypothetical protein